MTKKLGPTYNKSTIFYLVLIKANRRCSNGIILVQTELKQNGLDAPRNNVAVDTIIPIQ